MQEIKSDRAHAVHVSFPITSLFHAHGIAERSSAFSSLECATKTSEYAGLSSPSIQSSSTDLPLASIEWKPFSSSLYYKILNENLTGLIAVDASMIVCLRKGQTHLTVVEFFSFAFKLRHKNWNYNYLCECNSHYHQIAVLALNFVSLKLPKLLRARRKI